METQQNISDFLKYLEETLIPDLRENQFNATADDFERAANIIKQLQEKRG